MAVVTWDTVRVGNKNKECCGICFCEEDSVICCNGFFLSEKQRKYSGLAGQFGAKADKDPDAKKKVSLYQQALEIEMAKSKRNVGQAISSTDEGAGKKPNDGDLNVLKEGGEQETKPAAKKKSTAPVVAS